MSSRSPVAERLRSFAARQVAEANAARERVGLPPLLVDATRAALTPSAAVGGDPRALSDEDTAGFLEAAESRPNRRGARAQPQREVCMADIKARHPHRLSRLIKDYNWLAREAERAGIPSDEVRWLL